MFCENCGSNVENNEEFCPNCGTSAKGDDVVLNQQNFQGNYPLTHLTAKLYGIFFEIILWIILIGGIIGGGTIGPKLMMEARGPVVLGLLFGVILGGILASLLIILIGGLTSLFIKLVNNSEEIKKKLNEK